jgi:hypothetical protein
MVGVRNHEVMEKKRKKSDQKGRARGSSFFGSLWSKRRSMPYKEGATSSPSLLV